MAWFKNLLSSGIIAVSCICLPVVGGYAAERVSYDRALITRLPSTNDEIGIAFLKTANNFPDFATIVKDSDAYNNLNSLAQQDYLSKMTSQLQNNFLTFSPKKSDLVIRIKVNVTFKKLANGESVMTLTTFPNDPVYFPFYFAKYPIALIVKDMEIFRELHLDKADTDIVYSRLSLSGDATLLLQLYVLAADDKKTIMLDNIPQYPLLTEIGYIGLLNARSEQIWAWRNSKIGKKKVGSDLIDLVPAGKGDGFSGRNN